MQKPLLIEIGVEELPAIPLLKIVKNIEKSWGEILKSYRFDSEFEFLYTPRRLVLKHDSISTKQSDSVVELMGPPVVAAIKDGSVTKAGEGFAKKCGVEFSQLGRADKGGREVLYYKKEERGVELTKLLQEMISKWIDSMSFGKMMRWGSRSDEFIRPIRWLQVRLGESVVPMSIFGVESGDETFIHRMVDFSPQRVKDIDSYEELLSDGAVVLRPSQREERILSEFDDIEERYSITIERDRGLLAEIVAITENPKALLGSFDESFLELPPEVIITSMKEHQRYFAVYEKGKLTNRFVVVSNAYTDDYSKVIEGNEKVLKPRLADGMFFYYNDLRKGLSIDGLEKIQFMDGLGSLRDKIDRESDIAIRLLVRYLDQVESETSKSSSELEILMQRAVKLAKADLTSEMVYEFTELQGLMGYYYAKALGEDPSVYNAIKEQYMPVGEGAELPSSIFSSIVAISIKLDTLMGLFSIGKIPTGSKDPFALRRAVNGIIRIVIEHDLSFHIDEILELLSDQYGDFEISKLRDFIIERIYKSLDVNPSLIASVLASGEMDINEIAKKVYALDEIVADSSFKEQFITFKRVANISKDIDLDDKLSVDITLFSEDEEVALYNAYERVINSRYDDYKSKLEALFSLRVELDNYFDKVMVNVDDDIIKRNRQNMIGSIYKSIRDIADIKEISI
ncbi:Glycyl-tRNA synthetase beta chain [hydrothermal vent metagenome]|uniref:glycine--tRNA ligase n=1 Tax=hydrothermal vent metagenome TaxID=652676 RepID=A0A1W1BE95_9ZZZZ